MQQDEADE
jgi:hypothetical protein